MTTAAAILRGRSEDDTAALCFEEHVWTYRKLLEEASRCAHLFERMRDRDRPPHVGVLLDNVPDYLFWLAAGAISGTVIVGINSTYRGDQLGQLIRHTDCQLLVTDTTHQTLLNNVDTQITPDRVFVVDSEEYVSHLAQQLTTLPTQPVDEEDLFLLIFTSGSTGLPKAVRCTQGRYGRTGAHVAAIAQLSEGDVVYSPLPFFHSSSLFTGWASAMTAGIPIATRGRF